MIPRRFGVLTTLPIWALLARAAAGQGQPSALELVQQPWFESRTEHFVLYSCGPTQEVAKLAGRLEQFREAYALLAGAQAVASPPIVVLAFPDAAAMQPFLPLRNGKPANLTAFFSSSSEENIVVLPLAGYGGDDLQVVFHEYAHLLLRRNAHVWPLWLNEGMAEIYATFALGRGQKVFIGQPIERHLRWLTREPLPPLRELFAVTQKSPEYNQGRHQGLFYAESWLLTHFLMLGDHGALRPSLAQLTTLLRQGQSPEAAFTRAFRTPLPAMDTALRRYLREGRFDSLELSLPADLGARRLLARRRLTPAEVWFHLGDELLRVERPDRARSCFLEAQHLAPASPLSYEGLGLLAAEEGQSAEAVRYLAEAQRRGSKSFLADFVYAQEKLRLTARSPDRYSAIDKQAAAEIRAELQKSLALMPDFGPAHHLLGFLELVQGENLAAAQQHLQRAIQLEPENESYVLSLAQAQLRSQEFDAARHTLESLCRPYVAPQVRVTAEELLKGESKRQSGP